jgi:uncharacterized membrane protein
MRSIGIFVAVFLALSALCATIAAAAQISGTAYTEGLQPAKYSLLGVNTSPPQRVLLENGTYDLTLPAGTYQITVTYKERGMLYDDTANLTVRDDGQYTYDFILFPIEQSRAESLPAAPVVDVAEMPQQKHNLSIWPAAILLLALAAAAIIFTRWWGRSAKSAGRAAATTTRATGKSAAEEVNSQESTQHLAADLTGVIDAIKQEGGRTTQKELRKHIPCSEAKLSMMLTELEASGKVRKIKKGRGNLIILK